jgi:hypothetical protein
MNHIKIDRIVTNLSNLQIELGSFLYPEDFNNTVELIGELKEYLINCDSYKAKEEYGCVYKNPYASFLLKENRLTCY